MSDVVICKHRKRVWPYMTPDAFTETNVISQHKTQSVIGVCVFICPYIHATVPWHTLCIVTLTLEIELWGLFIDICPNGYQLIMISLYCILLYSIVLYCAHTFIIHMHSIKHTVHFIRDMRQSGHGLRPKNTRSRVWFALLVMCRRVEQTSQVLMRSPFSSHMDTGGMKKKF